MRWCGQHTGFRQDDANVTVFVVLLGCFVILLHLGISIHVGSTVINPGIRGRGTVRHLTQADSDQSRCKRQEHTTPSHIGSTVIDLGTRDRNTLCHHI